jgi:putative Mg2+ transporter-C (MgtC) family protein
MTLEDQALTSFYLVIAAFLSMLNGLDRERLDKSAGLRTHMLVGVGSCLFTILSAKAFDAADTSRVAANIVTGIGFLGAGVIYKSGGRVHDLTTAASVWITAAVGMAVGVGAWLLAIAATVTVWLILDTLRRYSKRADD